MKLTHNQRVALAILEKTAHAWAEEECNVPVEEKVSAQREEDILGTLRTILGEVPDGFFWNRDPRGYALKIDNEKAEIPPHMATDWGGYGLLAHPETREL